MSKKTDKSLPSLAQIEAELARLGKGKKRNATRGLSGAGLPTLAQITAERGRLRDGRSPKPRDKSRPARSGKRLVPLPVMEQVRVHREGLRSRSRYRGVVASTIGILLVVAAAAALIATLWLPVLQVSGSSMEPALYEGDIIVLNKREDFTAGDLVGLYYNGKIMLKRVIGQAGDYINMDEAGNVYVNGSCLTEPYVTGKSLGDCDVVFPLQVPEDSFFVLGDHRSISTDSRKTAIGCIPRDQIIGRVMVRIWPSERISVIQ